LRSVLKLRNDSNVHVQPIVLWQFFCGGVDLPVRDHQHIENCMACETFGEQILDALGRLETELHDRQVVIPKKLS
jgi:hypothetical protein